MINDKSLIINNARDRHSPHRTWASTAQCSWAAATLQTPTPKPTCVPPSTMCSDSPSLSSYASPGRPQTSECLFLCLGVIPSVIFLCQCCDDVQLRIDIFFAQPEAGTHKTHLFLKTHRLMTESAIDIKFEADAEEGKDGAAGSGTQQRLSFAPSSRQVGFYVFF